MRRYPDGAFGKAFFQKNAPTHMPEWIPTFHTLVSPRDGSRDEAVDRPPGGERRARAPLDGQHGLHRHEHVVLARRQARPPGLRALRSRSDARHAVGEHDPGGARSSGSCSTSSASRPSRRRRAARASTSSSRSTAGRPTTTRASFAELVAAAIARTHPKLATTEWSKARRRGVLIDANQNGQGKTIASAYSVRPNPHASVSTPLTWDEVDAGVDPAAFDMASVLERVRDARRSPRRPAQHTPVALAGAVAARLAGAGNEHAQGARLDGDAERRLELDRLTVQGERQTRRRAIRREARSAARARSSRTGAARRRGRRAGGPRRAGRACRARTPPACRRCCRPAARERRPARRRALTPLRPAIVHRRGPARAAGRAQRRDGDGARAAERGRRTGRARRCSERPGRWRGPGRRAARSRCRTPRALAIGSARSSPRSRAKWFRVPKGMQTNGMSRSTATAATRPSEPSPPAMPIAAASADRATASTSSPSPSTCTDRPRDRASSQSSPADGLPSPDLGLTMRKPLPPPPHDPKAAAARAYSMLVAADEHEPGLNAEGWKPDEWQRPSPRLRDMRRLQVAGTTLAAAVVAAARARNSPRQCGRRRSQPAPSSSRGSSPNGLPSAASARGRTASERTTCSFAAA